MDAGDVNHDTEPISQENYPPHDSHNEPFTHPIQHEKPVEEGTGSSTPHPLPTESIETPTLNTILSSKEEHIATTNALAENIASHFEAIETPQDTPSLPPQDAIIHEQHGTSPPPAPIYGDFGMEVDSAVKSDSLSTECGLTVI